LSFHILDKIKPSNSANVAITWPNEAQRNAAQVNWFVKWAMVLNPFSRLLSLPLQAIGRKAPSIF